MLWHASLQIARMVFPSHPLILCLNSTHTACHPPHTPRQAAVGVAAHLAGASHGVAASSGSEGHVYVWGSNQWGQLGTASPTAELITRHLLKEYVPVPKDKSLQDVVAKLPASLLAGMAAADAKAAHAAWREEGDNRMADTPEPQPELDHQTSLKWREAAGTQRASGLDSRKPPEPQFKVQHAQLKVYRLSLGMRVEAVACGTAHTLVAMADRGVWAWVSGGWLLTSTCLILNPRCSLNLACPCFIFVAARATAFVF